MHRYFLLPLPEIHAIGASEDAMGQKLTVNSVMYASQPLFYGPKLSFLLSGCDSFLRELSSLSSGKPKVSIFLNHIVYKITHKNKCVTIKIKNSVVPKINSHTTWYLYPILENTITKDVEAFLFRHYSVFPWL